MTLASNTVVFVAVWGGLSSLGVLPMPPEWAALPIVAVLGMIAGWVLYRG